MNIAIFGGSFDPPHLGHDMIVKEALKSLNINKLIIIPTFLSPFKSEFGAPPLLRFQWCNELWSNLDEKIIISDYEISQNRPVATIESVRYFKREFNPKKIYTYATHVEPKSFWDIDKGTFIKAFCYHNNDGSKNKQIVTKLYTTNSIYNFDGNNLITLIPITIK